MHANAALSLTQNRQSPAKETLKNSVSSILDLGESKTYIAPSVHFPIFSVSP